ncbi:class I SAM-dependent methyltransferase [Streptomyces yunnanensis]|uniref:Methyltransferase domain-containing protein n=1 Tax=Streptomyces yunnanensis TaxID=156453 RepID=A0A9X8N8R8_9ACTN|nr:class I SAM-dependent methyltransferase [Streptomyces yunnanensis]SHN29752.1 Methyltransferase domain-containing protein [Streptomyces yunnanensis]
MTHAHNDAVREQFRIQAATFTDEGFAARGLDWILEQLAPSADAQVLDVAAGAAHLGRALAPHVNHVCALDLTREMLEQGQRLATAAGLRNATFTLADAARLPYLDDQFDLVVCRLALHQVADPAAMVREMVRVTRPGGRIGVTDMIADEDSELAEETNRLERLRDPSHNRTLSLTEVHALLKAAGASVASTAVRDHDLDLTDWLTRSETPAPVRAQIRTRLEEELAGGTATGLRPARGDDQAISFTHAWATVTGTPRD